MVFDLDQRIERAHQRIAALTDLRCAEAHRVLAAERERNRAWLDAAFTHLRRSAAQEFAWIRRRQQRRSA